MDDLEWFKRVFGGLPAGPHQGVLQALKSGLPVAEAAMEPLLLTEFVAVKDFALVLVSNLGLAEHARMLIRVGARVDAHRQAAIRYGARTNNVDLAQVLLAAGADGGACGGEPLTQACSTDALEMAQFLWEATDTPGRARAARAARTKNSQRVLEWLLPLAVEPETQALEMACWSGNLPFVKTLIHLGLPEGADVLPRALAAASKQPAILALLKALQ